MKSFSQFGRSLGLIFVIAALGWGAYFYWTRSPSFAVRDLERSVRERDLAAFYTRVDLDRTLDSLIDAAATRSISRTPGDDWENIRERFRAEFSKLLKSQAMIQFRRDIERRFAGDDQLAPDVDAAMGNLAPIRRFLLRADLWSLGSLSTSGRNARINLLLHIPLVNKAYPLLLLLEKNEGGMWKVVGIEGIATVVDLFEKDAAAYVEASNRASQQEMTRILPMVPGEIRRHSKWLVNKELYLPLRFRNDSGFPVRSIEGRLSLAKADGTILISYPFRLRNTDLAPGAEKTYSITAPIKVFDKQANEAFATDDLRMNFVFERVSFEGRRALRTISSLDEEDAAYGVP